MVDKVILIVNENDLVVVDEFDYYIMFLDNDELLV